MKTENTYQATIHVGLKIRNTGEIQPYQKAFDICQYFVDEKKECISFTPTTYIYTNGFEPGVIIGFIQYPRFPKPEEEIHKRAMELAETLMLKLQQYKVSVVCPEGTYMLENDLGDDIVTGCKPF